MKNATVLIPFTGSIFVYLEDLPDETTEDECFDLALDQIPDRDNWHAQVNEIEYHKQVNRGNICYNNFPEMTVEFEQLGEDDSEENYERQPDTLRENEDFARDNEHEVNECDDLCL
jgi:hypothetical protein